MEHKGKMIAEYNINTELLTMRYMEADKKSVTVAIFERPNEREVFIVDRCVNCWNAFEEGGSLSKPLERLSKLKEQTFGPIAAELAGIIDDYQQIISQAEDIK